MEENVVMDEKKEKNKTLIKKILVIAGNVVFYAVVILLFLFSLMNINAGNGSENFPNLFGKGFLSVESNSMERKENGYHPEEWKDYYIEDIQKGDLVYADVFNGDLSTLKVGDVITFYDGALKALNTHRIVYIGETYVITQGDYIITQSQTDSYYYRDSDSAAKKNDLTSDHNVAQIVETGDIKGVVTGVKRGAGSVLSNIRQNWLFYFVIPVAVILLFEIFLVVKNILDLRHEKNKVALESDKETMMAELEAEKEKMRQELLAELKAQQEAEVKKEVTKPTEEVTSQDIEENIPEAKIEEPTVLDDTKEENTEE